MSSKATNNETRSIRRDGNTTLTMKAQEFDINKLRVASPCHVAWDAMTGNGRVRNCDSCKLNVFNISEMTAVEAESLIQTREGRLCIRLYKRADGTVITKDCPVGLRMYQKRIARLAGAAFTAVMGLFSVSFGQKDDKTSIDASKAGIVRTSNEKQETDLTGTVLDPNGAVIPGAEIRLFKVGDKKPTKTKSNDEGVYRFASLGVGVYSLEARYNGFKTNKIVGIEVKDNEIISIRIILQPKAVSVTVGIYADEPLIDTTSSSVTTVITRRKIETIPH